MNVPVTAQQRNRRADLSSEIGGTVVLIAAAALLGVIARAVKREDTQQIDQKVHETLQSHRASPVDLLARPVTLLSLPILVVTATAGLVLWLKQKDRTDAAIAIGLAPVAAATLGQTFTMLFPQRNPPDAENAGPGHPAEASFPSGHTTGVTAEALAIGYVLSREELISPPVLGVVLAWPVVVGMTRLYRDRHWASDIVAGWVAGAAVAAASALLYDILRTRKTPAP
jgi:undecaprenyl-diphosphatase